MELSSCLSHPRTFFQTEQGSLVIRSRHKLNLEGKSTAYFDSCSQIVSQYNLQLGLINRSSEWSFVGGCKIAARPNTDRFRLQKKHSEISSCWTAGTEFASCAFTLGTVAVLPFYTLMVFAPKSKITKKVMGSCIPHVVLGLGYSYLVYRSWKPDTISLLFDTKYWLPELPGIAKLFSSEMTLASAWIHMLVVDLFAARHVYHDGLKNEVETRHSISLCMLICPVGILSHITTKALTNKTTSMK